MSVMKNLYVVAAIPILLGAGPALAYIGPGAGLGALGAVWGFIIAILVAIVIVLSWPIRILVRKLKKNKPTIDTNSDID